MQCVPKPKNPCGATSVPFFSGAFKTAGLRSLSSGTWHHDSIKQRFLTLHCNKFIFNKFQPWSELSSSSPCASSLLRPSRLSPATLSVRRIEMKEISGDNFESFERIATAAWPVPLQQAPSTIFQILLSLLHVFFHSLPVVQKFRYSPCRRCPSCSSIGKHFRWILQPSCFQPDPCFQCQWLRRILLPCHRNRIPCRFDPFPCPSFRWRVSFLQHRTLRLDLISTIAPHSGIDERNKTFGFEESLIELEIFGVELYTQYNPPI